MWGEREPWYTVGGNAKWYVATMKNSIEFSQKLNIELLYNNSTSWYISKEDEITISKR